MRFSGPSVRIVRMIRDTDHDITIANILISSYSIEWVCER